ncbi:hypothetical protein N5J06_11125 [Ralstonia sp. CHL-2022]|uniref:Uncharacterized protein n=1 Tax=Ralstonia mojiangensis TaxID=2953895 RepID=A0ABT2LA06_9RALS|nr:hypothetical protein [Ralstonia mojiangensis]MCT7298856.1 hypothetical protein [Ralstonia mojiangensis]MCT7311499.1 hypothetical protein [Ralstonia mojiangensis]
MDELDLYGTHLGALATDVRCIRSEKNVVDLPRRQVAESAARRERARPSGTVEINANRMGARERVQIYRKC